MATRLGQGPASRRWAPVARDMLAHPQRILLVDDEEAFGYAAAKVLRKAGFEVSLAPDHRLALQIWRPPNPSIS